MSESAEVLQFPAVPATPPRGDGLIEKAKTFEVANPLDFEAGAELIRGCKDLAEKIKAHYAPLKTKAHEAHKAICTQEKEDLTPVETAERMVRGKLGAWKSEQDKMAREKAEEDRRRVEEEERAKRRAEVEALNLAGATAVAQRVEAEPLPVAPVLEAPKVPLPAQGTSTRKRLDVEVTDLRLLCKAIAEGTAPLTCVQPNIRAIADAIKGGYPSIPGVRSEWVEDLVVRR